jgi:hypothetical protein
MRLRIVAGCGLSLLLVDVVPITAQQRSSLTCEQRDRQIKSAQEEVTSLTAQAVARKASCTAAAIERRSELCSAYGAALGQQREKEHQLDTLTKDPAWQACRAVIGRNTNTTRPGDSGSNYGTAGSTKTSTGSGGSGGGQSGSQGGSGGSNWSEGGQGGSGGSGGGGSFGGGGSGSGRTSSNTQIPPSGSIHSPSGTGTGGTRTGTGGRTGATRIGGTRGSTGTSRFGGMHGSSRGSRLGSSHVNRSHFSRPRTGGRSFSHGGRGGHRR